MELMRSHHQPHIPVLAQDFEQTVNAERRAEKNKFSTLSFSFASGCLIYPYPAG